MKTILIIDDEPDILEIVADQIEISGFDLRVLTAATVEKAEELMPECDMILSDINMPNRTRLEEILSATSKPVARITGHADIIGEMIIRKPFKVEEFERVINLLIKQLG